MPAVPMIDNYIPQPGHDYQAGHVLAEMTGNRMGPNWARLRRPYFDQNDRPCVTINAGRYTVEKGERRPVLEKVYINDLHKFGVVGSPVLNATSLRKEEWLELDRVVLRAARYRLRAWADVSAANSFGGFNGMSKMLLEHETMSDPGEAIMDMDGLTSGRTDAPKFQLEGLPLPITHSDFWYSSRRLGISRNTGTPLDTTMGEAAGRRVAEMIEKCTIGNTTALAYGGASTQTGGYGRTSAVYGMINFTSRLTLTTLTAPTAGAWVPSTTLANVLTMRNTLYASKFFGPYMIYHSTDWDPYLDNDYYVSITSGAVAPTKTLRDRLRAIEGVQDVKRLDFLFASSIVTDASSASYKGPGGENLVAGGGGTLGANPFTLIMVQMTPDVIRAVNGMDITTVQWESVGGMRLNFKVMCIQVPQVRADIYGNCGILHATTA